VHQLLLEVHVAAWGCHPNYLPVLRDLELNMDFIPSAKIVDQGEPYNGQYDNLLFFFSFMYDLIHRHYDHDKLLSYKRPFTQ
jgi:hypothetical protein